MTVAAILGLAAVLAMSGFQTFNDHVLSGGLVGRYYWFDGSASAALENRTYSAKWSWGNATSLIALGETTASASATFRVYQSSTIFGNGEGYCARAVPANTSWVEVNPDATNWSRAKLVIGNEAVSGAPGCANSLGIVEHEFGHTFGLAHIGYNGWAVMNDWIAGRTDITAPTVDDINGIQDLY